MRAKNPEARRLFDLQRRRPSLHCLISARLRWLSPLSESDRRRGPARPPRGSGPHHAPHRTARRLPARGSRARGPGRRLSLAGLPAETVLLPKPSPVTVALTVALSQSKTVPWTWPPLNHGGGTD